MGYNTKKFQINRSFRLKWIIFYDDEKPFPNHLNSAKSTILTDYKIPKFQKLKSGAKFFNLKKR